MGENLPAKHAKHAKNRNIMPLSSLRSPFTCRVKLERLKNSHFSLGFSMFSVFSGKFNRSLQDEASSAAGCRR
jgi:hypothetical protein